jgi:type IV pilus assembly protein PilV
MKAPLRQPMKPYRWRAARGVGLLDALIAMTILTFGILGMTRLQARMVSQGSETQSRMAAARLADELLNSALVDPANATCYTVPYAVPADFPGPPVKPWLACGKQTDKDRTAAWAARSVAELPGTPTAGAVLDGITGRLTVTLTWTGKESQEPRTLVAVTDVRP